jgi:hypothetical protein
MGLGQHAYIWGLGNISKCLNNYFPAGVIRWWNNEAEKILS